MKTWVVSLAFVGMAAAQPAVLERQYREALRELEREGPSVLLSDALNGLGAFYFEHGDFGRAESFSRKALEVEQSLEQPRELEVARRFGNIAAALASRGKCREADPWIRKALTIYAGHADAEERAFAYNTLGTIELCRKDMESAARDFGRAAELWKAKPVEESHALANLALVKSAMGRVEDALALWERAFTMIDAQPERGADYGRLLCGYADALRKAGRKDEAANVRQRGRALVRESVSVGHTVDVSEFR